MKIPASEEELLKSPCNDGYERRSTFPDDAKTVFVVNNPCQMRPIQTLERILKDGEEWNVEKKSRVWWTISKGNDTRYLHLETGEVAHSAKRSGYTPMEIGFPSRQAFLDTQFAVRLSFSISEVLRSNEAGRGENLPVLQEVARKLRLLGF